MTYTVSQAREKDGKTHWTRLGVAFRTKDGRGLNVVLNALPMSDRGEARILIMPQQERKQESPPPEPRPQPESNDEIPWQE